MSHRGKGVSTEQDMVNDQEVSPPLNGGRGGGRGRGRSARGRGKGQTERELFPSKPAGKATAGTKRKAMKNQSLLNCLLLSTTEL
jgi:hypothetical protein